VRTRAWSVAEVVVALAVSTAVVWALEGWLQAENAGTVYLLGVAVVAVRQGTIAALLSAIAAFLLYNVLFVEPRFTLGVERPDELITLVLLLIVGLIIGQLGGAQRERERLAARREREARALFAISRELATAPRLTSSLPIVLGRLCTDAGMTRAWLGLGPTIGNERSFADTDPDQPIEAVGSHVVLRRDPDEGAATWVRIRPGGPTRRVRTVRYRVALTADGSDIGSLWSERSADDGPPALEETRLLAATADQVAQAIRRDRLAAAAADAEIERRSDELRRALLDSVSHDLRTPLATIRAAAGSLADPAIDLSDDERRATARAIDDEAERLRGLVDSLLDMGRIQSGALAADLEVTPLAELLEPIIERSRPRLAGRLDVQVPDDLPAVLVDQTFLSQAVTNVLDNAVEHTPTDAAVAVIARASGGWIEIAIEDAGPGVTQSALPRLFDRFYRVPGALAGARRGVGVGLTVARGLTEAMGGTVTAAPSALGGLAVTIRVPAAPGTAESPDGEG
jgi:two-component system, OmpR family, sensor histidine kinase KdpD